MIDTIKIYSEIDKTIFDKVSFLSDVKQGLNKATGELYYEIVNDHLLGSYDCSLSVRVNTGEKYKLGGYVMEIEGSAHKILRGQNAYNGFYNLSEACEYLIGLTEFSYDISLPSVDSWHLQRVDIAKCFDLSSQKNVFDLINNFRFLHFPRRQVNNYGSSGVYFKGTTTTLKIYNKWLDFLEHDKKRVNDYNKNNNNISFDIDKYYEKVKGFVRYEVEIKSKIIKKLCDEFSHDNCIKYFTYDVLESVFNMEFKKVFKECDEKLEKVYKKNDVMNRLYEMYKPSKASLLYAFYLNLVVDGYDKIKSLSKSSTFYRNISGLVDAGIDYTQSDFEFIEKKQVFYLDIFSAKEVS